MNFLFIAWIQFSSEINQKVITNYIIHLLSIVTNINFFFPFYIKPFLSVSFAEFKFPFKIIFIVVLEIEIKITLFFLFFICFIEIGWPLLNFWVFASSEIWNRLLSALLTTNGRYSSKFNNQNDLTYPSIKTF